MTSQGHITGAGEGVLRYGAVRSSDAAIEAAALIASLDGGGALGSHQKPSSVASGLLHMLMTVIGGARFREAQMTLQPPKSRQGYIRID